MRTLLKAAIVSVLSLCLSAHSVSAVPLFAPHSDESSRAKAALLDSAYRALTQEPAMAELQIVAVAAAQVSRQTEMLSLNLAPGVLLTARRVDSYRTKTGLI